MTPKEWDRLKPLYDRAVALDPVARAAFVERVRLDDETTALKLSELIGAGDLTIDAGDRTNSLDAPVPALRDKARAFAVDELVLNRFRIVRFLGRGGMGEVYEATDLHLGRVALKTIRPDIAASEHGLARFRREVQLARRITHGNVCRIYDLFAVPARPGHPATTFLTMEYLAGVTLAERIESSGPLPLAEAESVALQLCAAVEAIHDAGIVHRDLKAWNIMLVPDPPRVVVMDLGLARESESEAGDPGITRANAVMGTPEYMAPEQFQGHGVTPAADIYALGIVFYEMVTGSRPFRGATPIGAAVMRGKRPPAASSIRRELPGRWDEVIEKCIEFDPERRFPSAGAVAAALQGRRFSGFHLPPRYAVAVLAVIVIAALAGAVFWYRAHSYTKPSPDAQRWYEQGVAALRGGTWYKATQALTRAVELDPDFVVAHARLADAWSELDFTGKAKDEMLRASGLQSKIRLPQLDARYLDAVRTSLTFDYAASLADYRAILKQLPAAEKAYGYFDVGRALEKTNNIAEAMKSYAEASRLAPEFPASFVRLGILDSRKGDDAAGKAAFSRAEYLYRASSDVEGIAEVAYERGYAASLRADDTRARELLQQALRAAEDIPSVQLEIRALIRMSAVEYFAGRADESVNLATRAIQLAHEKGLDYWATDGLVRLGNAWLAKGDYAKAEPPLEEALRLARESQRPRLEAGARFSLANVRSAQDKPDEAIAFAQAALDYYKQAGFDADATSALVIIVRAERDKADFKTALARATQALDLARKSNNPASLMLVEELVGTVLLRLENYPEALLHFQAALEAARSIQENVEYETEHCADALWRLGRYDEANAMLASIPADIAKLPRIAPAIDLVKGRMLLSRLDSRGALALARRVLAGSAGLNPGMRIEFEILAQSLSSCRTALEQAEKGGSSEPAANARVCVARADFASGSYGEALQAAEAALRFYEESGQKESQWRTRLLIARIHEASGSSDPAKKSALDALALLTASEHDWGNPVFQTYSHRPDIEAERRELTRLLRK